MLMIIGKVSSLDVRLQYVLPYILKFYQDKQSKVVSKAIETSIKLFEDILTDEQDCILSNTDL